MRHPHPKLDSPYPRVMCGATGCQKVIAKVRPSARYKVVMIPVGLTDDGTPGHYRWAGYARQERDDDRPPVNRHTNADLYDERFARLPCVIPCPIGHGTTLTVRYLRR